MVGDHADAMLEVMDEVMDEARHKGRYRRIEMITGRRQRRNWTDEEKARILAESAEPDVNISGHRKVNPPAIGLCDLSA